MRVVLIEIGIVQTCRPQLVKRWIPLSTGQRKMDLLILSGSSSILAGYPVVGLPMMLLGCKVVLVRPPSC